LFVGPLLAIHGKARIPESGGDKIGLRKIDTHLEVFKTLGGKIAGNSIILDKKIYNSPRPIQIWLSEPSVTATENALLMSALRLGKTIIKNAACEPHVTNLGIALMKGGVKIAGLGTNLITINGVKKLKPVVHRVSEDFMEVGSALVLSAIFNGQVKVKSDNADDYQKIFESFAKFNKKIIYKNGYLQALPHKPAAQNTIEEISDGPWPSFPSDLMSSMIILATQCDGHFLFHEKMFESRLYFTDSLKRFGAQLVLCDPHRVIITGPSVLHGGRMTSPDIRAGMALVIAALTAKGESTIDNVEQLDRGYENLVQKLKNVGADIKRE
jgi:UDP-N-acetylglucosamine 1-carboxyvinyltransferase